MTAFFYGLGKSGISYAKNFGILRYFAVVDKWPLSVRDRVPKLNVKFVRSVV